MLPVVMLSGIAGVGKDTLANHLVKKYDAISIGQADPLKLMARDFFGFNNQQLFGPSHYRNELDKSINLNEAEEKISSLGSKWVQQLFPDMPGYAYDQLAIWFLNCRQHAKKEEGLSPRYVLQTLGTDWGRNIDPDVWINYTLKVTKCVLGGEYIYSRTEGLKRTTPQCPPNFVIITDGRFPNEIIAVKATGGITVKIIGPSKAQAGGIAGHSSETSIENIPPHFFNFVIDNNWSLEDLFIQGDNIVRMRVMK